MRKCKRLFAALIAATLLLGTVPAYAADSKYHPFEYAEPGKPLDSYSNSYDDVRPGSWYYDAVMVLTEGGLFGGYGNGKFGPNDTITFGQFKIVMSRLTGGKAYGPVSSIDLSTQENRMPMTRGVTAQKLYEVVKNYYGYGLRGVNTSITSVDDFPDTEAIIDWFYLYRSELYPLYNDGVRAMSPTRTGARNAANSWVVPAVQYGWFRGVDSKGTFNAAGTLTRAQFCQVLYNAGWLVKDCPYFTLG